MKVCPIRSCSSVIIVAIISSGSGHVYRSLLPLYFDEWQSVTFFNSTRKKLAFYFLYYIRIVPVPTFIGRKCSNSTYKNFKVWKKNIRVVVDEKYPNLVNKKRHYLMVQKMGTSNRAQLGRVCKCPNKKN